MVPEGAGGDAVASTSRRRPKFAAFPASRGHPCAVYVGVVISGGGSAVVHALSRSR